MSIVTVEDALGLSATVFNRNYVTSATEFQVQINDTTRVVIKGSFGGPGQPPYTRTYDAPQVGTISSFELWHTSNVTSAAQILGKIVITGGFERLETLFTHGIYPADAVRSAIPRNIVVPTGIQPVHEGGATYFDIAQTDGTFLRFLGNGLVYDADGYPMTDQGSIYGVIELDANKQDFGTGYTHFSSAALGQITVSPGDVYAALFDDMLIPSFFAELFAGAGQAAVATGNISGITVPFANFFADSALNGGAEAERFDGYFGDDTFNGGGGNDVIVSRSGADALSGGVGADDLNAGSGADRLFGNAGDDKLNGGAGSDRLTGGAGRDLLTGGLGADRFVFTTRSDSGTGATTRDQILDFRHGQGDKIDLSAIDAIPGGANNAFKLDTGGSFVAGELKIVTSGNDKLLYLNLDADAAAETVIQVVKPGVFGVGDIIL